METRSNEIAQYLIPDYIIDSHRPDVGRGQEQAIRYRTGGRFVDNHN